MWGAPQSAPESVNLQQNPPRIISLSRNGKDFCERRIFFILYKMYVTLKLDDSGCIIQSISDGNEEIVTNQRYVVMPWKMVTRNSTNMRQLIGY